MNSLAHVPTLFCRSLIRKFAAGAMLLALACSSSPSSNSGTNPPPDGSTPDGSTSAGAIFGFLDGTDTVSQAMAALVRNGDVVPETQADADAWFKENNDATEVILANLPAVQAALLAALQGLPAGKPHGYFRLMRLLELAGHSPEILDLLHGVAMAPLAPGEETAPGDEPSDAELTRGIGVGLLHHHAKNGNGAAKGLLRDAAASPAFGVRTKAVQYFLGLSHDRRLAQRELAAKLPAADQYLLYQN